MYRNDFYLYADGECCVKLVAIRASTTITTISIVACATAAGRLVTLIVIHTLIAVKVLNKSFWTCTPVCTSYILCKQTGHDDDVNIFHHGLVRKNKTACNPSTSFVKHASTQTEHYILQIDIIMHENRE